MCMATISKPAVYLVVRKRVYSVSWVFDAVSISMAGGNCTYGLEIAGQSISRVGIVVSISIIDISSVQK